MLRRLIQNMRRRLRSRASRMITAKSARRARMTTGLKGTSLLRRPIRCRKVKGGRKQPGTIFAKNIVKNGSLLNPIARLGAGLIEIAAGNGRASLMAVRNGPSVRSVPKGVIGGIGEMIVTIGIVGPTVFCAGRSIAFGIRSNRFCAIWNAWCRRCNRPSTIIS